MQIWKTFNKWDFYVSIPTKAAEADFSFSVEKTDGYVLGNTLDDFNLAIGEVNNVDDMGNSFPLPLEEISIDLTAYDKWWRAQDGNSGNINYFNKWIGDDKSLIITQSGEEDWVRIATSKLIMEQHLISP